MRQKVTHLSFHGPLFLLTLLTHSGWTRAQLKRPHSTVVVSLSQRLSHSCISMMLWGYEAMGPEVYNPMRHEAIKRKVVRNEVMRHKAIKLWGCDAWSIGHGPFSMIHGPLSMVHSPWFKSMLAWSIVHACMMYGPWPMVHGPWSPPLPLSSYLIDSLFGLLLLCAVKWLIQPVVICLSRRLAHACLSMSTWDMRSWDTRLWDIRL